MSTQKNSIVSFLNDLIRRRKCSPNQLAAALGVNHATVYRWFSGKDIPNSRSCQKLAEYSGVPAVRVLSIAGHLPRLVEKVPAEWPEFSEYARRKYPDELDDDVIALIEDLIERRREKRRGRTDS